MCTIFFAKQDKQLYDSKIYNFKHEGYHKVNCIGKEAWVLK
jgi:hypothetical protein